MPSYIFITTQHKLMFCYNFFIFLSRSLYIDLKTKRMNGDWTAYITCTKFLLFLSH